MRACDFFTVDTVLLQMQVPGTHTLNLTAGMGAPPGRAVSSWADFGLRRRR